MTGYRRVVMLAVPIVLGVVLITSAWGGVQLPAFQTFYEIVAIAAGFAMVSSAVMPQHSLLRAVAAAVSISVYLSRAAWFATRVDEVGWGAVYGVAVLCALAVTTALWALTASIMFAVSKAPDVRSG